MKLSTIFALIGFFLIGTFIFVHEKVHQEIFKSDGIKSRIGFKGTIVTISEEACKTSECELAHNINEIVGYQLMPIFLLLWLGLFIIIEILEEKYET